MEHLMESRSGEQTARDTASQAEQILSLLERRGLVEDPSIINPKARETEQELRRNMYHNTKMMLKHYRDIVWALECFPQKIAEELNRPLRDLDALLSVVDTQIAMGNAKLEHRMLGIQKSRVLLDRINDALTVLRHKPGNGEMMYNTACSYAMSLGWLSEPAVRAAATTRGEMALLLYRALTGAHPADLSLAPQETGDGCLTNGKPVTEENVLELLRQLEQDWPQDTVWGTHKTPGTHKNEVPSTAANRIMDVYWVSEYYGCSGYAAMISSLIFGDDANPGRQLEDLSQIRPGDIVFIIDNSTGTVGHVRVAVESPNEINAFHYTDGNNGGVIHWPDREYLYGRENLDCYRGMNKACRLEAWTRYPESIPYTGSSVNAWPTGYRA